MHSRCDVSHCVETLWGHHSSPPLPKITQKAKHLHRVRGSGATADSIFHLLFIQLGKKRIKLHKSSSDTIKLLIKQTGNAKGLQGFIFKTVLREHISERGSVLLQYISSTLKTYS